MKVENPAAFRFLFQDDVYLLNAEKHLFAEKPKKPADAIAEIPDAAIETEVISFNYKGNNNKRFLVLAHYPGIECMDEAHLAALTSTLTRKQLSLDDVAIVNLALYALADINVLCSYFKPEKLLVLGKDAVAKGLSVPFNRHATHNNIAVLFTYGFAEMMSSNENKKAFWEQVKTF
ncbi:hypothetical protein EOD41_04585 [Mucilaginibacter limnophilus]|uniref:Uncharacterized protein n=1 Tax=Mucilaginibacter limnophilus TaxID=1932778 RepID=A0A437MUA1_9SPHI|nr:hypothetical protein [Mucilaginibacter limnophilus]RVU01248.1 hypothetical protein EOD41_04585 [Mucilaginibacter limnophilus]